MTTALAWATEPTAVAPIAPEHRGWTCTGRCVHPHALDCEAERGDRPTGRACLCVCHDGSEGRS
jgi:hypothetical protein